MKLSEYMAEVKASATGERTGRQMVLAVDCSVDGKAASVGEYAVIAQHIENHGASLSPNTVDKSYIGEGETTLKTGTKKGEKGTVTIAVNKDGSGAAGDPGDIDVTLSVDGTPDEFTYAEA